MRSSTLTKSIGLLNLFFYTFSVLAANNLPNLTTDRLHITGETGVKILSLDVNKQVKSTTYAPLLLDDVVNATSLNTPSTIVKRDGSGNFSAGTITADLNGTALSARPRVNYLAKTSNYTASVGDWIECSGADFNVTLPDATVAGTSGKPIIVQNAGTWPQKYTILTTGGQTIVGPPNNTIYTSGQVILYTPNEHMEFWPTGSGWKLKNHASNTGWIDLGNFVNFITFTNTAASATLAAVYSPAETFSLVAAANSTAAATYVPGYIFTTTAAAVTAAATYQPGYLFTVTAANATVAAVYKDTNGASYTVAATIAGATQLVVTGTATPPAGPGTLTFFSGVGDAVINYSSFSGNPTTFATFTDQVTIAGGTTMTTTSPVASIGTLAATGKLVKLAGTGDAVVTYSAATGFASGTTTCTTAATIAAATSLVMTCTLPPPAGPATLVKTAGTGDIPIPYNSVAGEDTASGTKAYKVTNTIVAGLNLTTQNEVAVPTLTSGKLGKISGTGDTVITYSSFTGAINTHTATTTTPIFYGLPTLNNWKFRRVDGQYAELWIKWYHTSAGVNATGDIILKMPTGLTIDTGVVAASTGGTPATCMQSTNTVSNGFWSKVVGVTAVNASTTGHVTAIMPYNDGNNFRLYLQNDFASTGCAWGGAAFNPGNTNVMFNMFLMLPTLGWIP